MKGIAMSPLLLGAVLSFPTPGLSQDLQTPLMRPVPPTGYEGVRLDPITLLPVTQKFLTIGGKSKDGRPQLLFFFTTYCQYCEITVAAINTARQKLSGEGALPVVGVSLSPIEATKEFAARTGAAFPIGVMESFAPLRHLGIMAVPAVALIDASGDLTYSRVGAATIHTTGVELYDAYMAAAAAEH